MNKVRLGDVITLHRGFDLPNSQREPGAISVISSSGITGTHSKSKLSGKNVITGRYGTIGKVFYHEGDCWPLNTTLYVSDFHGNDERYAAFLLETVLASIKIDGTDKSTVPGVDRNVLHALEVPFIDDVNRQRATALVLAALDDKIALNKRMMAELEQTAQLIYDYWFTQFDFPNEEGKPYRSSGGKMVYNPTLKREIPEGWKAGKLSDLGKITSGATPSTSDSGNYAANGVPWITPNDLSTMGSFLHIDHGERDISTQGLAACSAALISKGSVIMSSRAPIGYLAIAGLDCCTNQGCKSFSPSSGYGTYFLYYTLKRLMPAISSQGSGTTFKEVSKDVLGNIPVLIPPHEVASKFESTAKGLHTSSSTLENETRNLSSLRDWLLPMLMSGQVTVK